MKCPQCGANCWRNEVDVGVGIISDEWKCENCDWSEDDGFPMEDYNWEDFLEADNLINKQQHEASNDAQYWWRNEDA